MGCFHLSLTCRLSKGRLEKTFLKWGSRTKKFEKPCASELFKGSNGSTSLLACTQKIFWLGVVDFFE